MITVNIRFCNINDLEALYSIEKSSHPVPWPRAIMQTDLATGRNNIVYLCAEWQDVICGFSAFSRKRRTLRVMNLAVLPEYRRQGVASQLLLAMEEMAKLWGCKEMALEVRESNYGAQALYARFGFYKARRLGRYYSDGEAAFLMKARLPLRVQIQKNPT